MCRQFTHETVTAYVALGGNLGDAVSALVRAVEGLAALPQTRLLRKSWLYSSAPVASSGPDYVNAVVKISTALTAPALLFQLQKIEQSEGRERPWPNAPRTLDLDLLLYGSSRMDGPTLTVPHPRMGERAFVLLPLADLDTSWATLAAAPAVAAQRITRSADPRWIPSVDVS